MIGALVGGAVLGGIGSLLQGNSDEEASRTLAQRQLEASKAAADAARFRPVGVTGSPFGTANYGYDAQGNLTSAGYTPSAFTQGQQNQLMGASGGMLNQFTESQAATAPMGAGAQSMFNLGQQYLTTSPEAQAAKYMQQQQALLAAPRAEQLAALRANQQATGRGGLSIGGDAGMMATNPEMAAYYNALAQQDMGLAAQSTQGGMDFAKYGAGMIDAGGSTLRDMYGTQTASYAPYQTAIGGIESLDKLAQQPMTQGMQYGAMLQPSRQAGGEMLGQGMNAAAQTNYQADRYNPLASMLQGAGNALGNFGGSGSMFGLGGGSMPQQQASPQMNYSSAFGMPQQQYNFGTFMGRSL